MEDRSDSVRHVVYAGFAWESGGIVRLWLYFFMLIVSRIG